MKGFLIVGTVCALVFIILGRLLPGPPRHWLCGSEADVIPIAYGLPGMHMMEQAGQGKIYLGGCMIERERWYCRRCQSKW